MKKLIITCMVGLGLLQVSFGQNWLRYEADVLPAETAGAAFDLSAVSQNAPGTPFVEEIEADTAIANNSYLKFISIGGTKMYLFNFRDTAGTAYDGDKFTIIARIKGFEDWEAMGLERVFDIQPRNGVTNTRDEFRIAYGSNRIELDRADVSVDSIVDLTQWHIYRIVVDSNLYSVFLDEDDTPVISGISAVTSSDRYLKIGDGSSQNIGGLLDWIAIDTTGAYSPTESALDESFTGYGNLTTGFKKLEASEFKVELTPNPFTSLINVSFQTQKAGPVKIYAYDASGKMVASLLNQNFQSGNHYVELDGTTLKQGNYFIEIVANGQKSSKKMIKL